MAAGVRKRRIRLCGEAQLTHSSLRGAAVSGSLRCAQDAHGRGRAKAQRRDPEIASLRSQRRGYARNDLAPVIARRRRRRGNRNGWKGYLQEDGR